MDNICELCHKKGNGCCYFIPTGENQQIGLFIDDIKKIETFLNIDMDNFITIKEVSQKFIEFLYSTTSPLLDMIFYKNRAYLLKTVEHKCIFLSDDGCKLPIDIRPLYCRVYPFWASPDFKNIFVLSSYDCLAQSHSTLNWKIVNEHFGYTEEYLFDMFFKMREYGERHKLFIDNSPSTP